MPTYAHLFSWTDQGVRNFRQTVDRVEAARKQWEESGLRVREIVWTIGQYDLIAISEAPDDETVAAAMLALGEVGNVRTTTLQAFDADEMRGVIARAG